MVFERQFFAYVLLVAFMTTQLLFFVACDSLTSHLGVCYGTLGNNLPTPQDTINQIKKDGMEIIRIYDPNPDILNALRGSNIYVLVGVNNQDIPSLVSNPDAARIWVNTNIVPYKGSVLIIYISVGNEVIPGLFAAYVAQAIVNVRIALDSLGLSDIRVTTSTYFNLQTSFPPSAGAFPPEIVPIMKDVTSVLRKYTTRTSALPLFVSIYPYFAYASNPRDISLEYATFRAQTPVVDGNLQYFSLLEAQMDAYHAALDKIGAGDIGFIVAETGWPTTGNEPYTSVANAQAYNMNLKQRILSKRGTPRYPSVGLDAIIFSMFDENQKETGIEQNWGLYYPNLQPKYPLN